jgi:CubicO group peptidase (beta-lactamase class C family)
MERITQLRDICSVPSISLGILHYGEVIHMESCGFRDVEESLPANPDTIYLLSSLSKGFLSAAVGVAVSEGKMAWKTPLSHYIPEFKHPDPAVCEKANLNDFLRHSTGLSSPQLLVLGPRGTLIHPEKGLCSIDEYISFL